MAEEFDTALRMIVDYDVLDDSFKARLDIKFNDVQKCFILNAIPRNESNSPNSLIMPKHLNGASVIVSKDMLTKALRNLADELEKL